MIIQQALFGYSNGHHLLASSIDLSGAMLKVLEPLSDLSGTDYNVGFLEYLTGYFFDQQDYFALSKTWHATEMDRPGCAWTHTLLISLSDLDKFPEVSDYDKLFCRPSNIGEYASYREPKVIEPEIHFKNNTEINNSNKKIRKILETVFESPRPVLIGANSASEYDNIFLKIWGSLGKSVLNGESFCTGALSNRLVYKKPLDFQVVPISKIKNILRSAQCGVMLNDKESEESEWLNVIISNFIDHDDNKLIDYIEKIPSKEHNRFFIKSCAKISVVLQNCSTANPSLIINAFSPELTFIEKKNIFNQTILEMLNGSNGVFNIHFSEINILKYITTMSKTELDMVEQETVIQILENLFTKVVSLPMELFTFLINNEINPLGDKMIHSLALFAYKTDLENVTGSDMRGSHILVILKPELSCNRKIWCSSRKIQLSVINSLKSSTCIKSVEFSKKLTNTIFETSTENISEELYETFGSKIVKFFLDWTETNYSTNRIKHWIGLCQYDIECFIDFLPHNKNETIDKSVILLIDPYSNLIMNISSDFHIDFFRKYVVNCTDNKYRMNYAQFILPVILKSKKMYPLDIAFFAFDSVYLSLSKGCFDNDEWRKLSQLLPEIGWNNNWDKCKRLKNAAKKLGYRFEFK
ncbi:MAG: hypothetical protein CVU92_01960 [Firmicutes bacterium HGW-Firmicutes-17]|jgi:hypothetical protein|nr:MAG: hypothetical protein CVU92_01960 [Firmicutes bacterium HGW-Firmicutes-17]